jgi:hypothetical protein
MREGAAGNGEEAESLLRSRPRFLTRAAYAHDIGKEDRLTSLFIYRRHMERLEIKKYKEREQ